MNIEFNRNLKDCGEGQKHQTLLDNNGVIENNFDILLKDSEHDEKHDILLGDVGNNFVVKDEAEKTQIDFGDQNISDILLKASEREEKYDIHLEDPEARIKADASSKHFGGNGPDLSLKNCEDGEKCDILLEDIRDNQEVKDEPDNTQKDFGDKNNDDILLKDSEREEKHDIHLEDPEARIKADASSKHFGGNGPALSLKNCEDGEKCDILLEDIRDNQEVKDEPDNTQKDFGDKNNDDILLKDSEREEKHDIHLEDHEGRDKADASSKHFGGNSPDLSLKNCEEGEKPYILLEGGDNHEVKDEADKTQKDFILQKDSEREEKHDILLEVSPRNRDLKDIIDALLDLDPQPFHGKESAIIKKGKKCEDKHNELNTLLRDLEGRDEIYLPSKYYENRGKDSNITSISSETQKVSKSNWKRTSYIESASLYQAYLDMIQKSGKKKKTDLLSEKKIESPNIGKSNTISEHEKSCISKTAVPAPLKKINNKKEFSWKLSRNHPYQKKSALRRDLLAESSEEFLSILDSAGCSKKSDKRFDDRRKLDLNPPDSNEMYKSRDVIDRLTPSSTVSFKRKAEQVLPPDFRIPKKGKINSPQPLMKIESIHDFQVVIMKDSRGSPMRKVDLDEVQYLLNAEVARFILHNEKSHFIPKFFGFRVDQNHEWFILNCKDLDTMNWVLNWKPLNAKQSFTIVKSKKAPWRSIRICFTIRKEKLDVKKVVKLLASQNRILNVTSWSHIEITGRRGEWTLYFLLTVDESKLLDEVGWVIFFELGMLQVLKL